MPAAVIQVVSLLDDGRQAGRFRIFNSQNVALLVIMLTLIFAGSGQIKKLILTNRLNSAISNTLIESLLEMPRTLPVNVVLEASNEAFEANPVRECTAKPFLYPAISERPWIGIIRNTGCVYQYYGYLGYGVTPSNAEVTVRPRLLPGMDKIHWPEASLIEY